ncbi:MAG: helix-turn-helix transcriptional regulator [Arenicellales bacterium]
MKLVDLLPSGKIVTTQDIGKVVRKARKKQGATQAEFASLCSVGVRFISELENGKATAQVGKLLQVLKCLGLEISIHPRGWANHQQSAQE